MALTTTVPTIGDTGDNLHEPADGLYAREEYMLGSGAWAPTGRGGVANSADISFGIPGADWGNVVGWALCSGMSGGNTYYVGELVAPMRVLANTSGDPAQDVEVLLGAGSIVVLQP